MTQLTAEYRIGLNQDKITNTHHNQGRITRSMREVTLTLLERRNLFLNEPVSSVTAKDISPRIVGRRIYKQKRSQRKLFGMEKEDAMANS